MRTASWIVSTGLLLLIACGGSRTAADNETGPAGNSPAAATEAKRPASNPTGPGEWAPSGTVVANDQGTVVLDSLWFETPVILVFYRGHWCPHCMKQLGELHRAYETISSLKADLVAVSASPDDAEKVRQKLRVTFPLYSDPKLETIRAWKIADEENEIAFPATFVIAPGGEIVFSHIGKSPPDRPVLDDVIEALRASRASQTDNE